MEGGAEKKRKRERKKKRKDFECDGEEGCHGRSVEVSASVMGLFSELAFNGSGSSSGGTGHASIWPSIKKFEKKEAQKKKRRMSSPRDHHRNPHSNVRCLVGTTKTTSS